MPISPLLLRGMGFCRISMVPRLGSSSPVSACSRVDLPAPLGPSTAVTEPFGTVKLTLSRMTAPPRRSEEHTSELQSLMRISYAVFCLKKKNKKQTKSHDENKSNSAHVKNSQ